MSNRHCIISRFLGRRTLITAAVLLVVALLHAEILRMLAWPLAAASSSAPADYFCIHGAEGGADGFHVFEVAAERHGKSAGEKVLLLLPRTSRIVEIGALPSFEQMSQSELSKRGLPPADVWPIRAEAHDAWGTAHDLHDWLRAHPDSTVSFACSPFTSGLLRYAFNKVVDPRDAGRVRLAVLPDPDCRLEGWWRNRRAVKEFMYAWLLMIFARAEGDVSHPDTRSAAQFQEELRARFGKASP